MEAKIYYHEETMHPCSDSCLVKWCITFMVVNPAVLHQFFKCQENRWCHRLGARAGCRTWLSRTCRLTAIHGPGELPVFGGSWHRFSSPHRGFQNSSSSFSEKSNSCAHNDYLYRGLHNYIELSHFSSRNVKPAMNFAMKWKHHKRSLTAMVCWHKIKGCPQYHLVCRRNITAAHIWGHKNGISGTFAGIPLLSFMALHLFRDKAYGY